LATRVPDAGVPLPVLIVGEGTGALGAARSLARAGVTVYCAHKRRRGAGLASRYWKRRFLVPDHDFAFERHLAAVMRAVDAIGGPVVLVPTGDREAVIVAEAAAGDSRVVAPRQAPDLIRALINKPQMLALAARHGLRTPRTVQPASAEDARRWAEEFMFPVILKMADPVRLWKQNFVFRNAEELSAWSAAVPADLFRHVVVQEWIPGEDSDSWVFNGYFDERSSCLAAFAGRKLRQVPVFAGVGSLAVCERNDELYRQSVGFLAGIRYVGPVDIDYRRDHRDGVYKILDVNPRIGGVFRLGATADGLDLVRVLYRHLTGQPVPPYSPVEGRKWMVEDDLVAAFRHWQAGRLGLREWAASLRGVREAAYLALDDPLPVIVWAASKVRKAAMLALRRRAADPREFGRGKAIGPADPLDTPG
jgi:D-aspartate ligase